MTVFETGVNGEKTAGMVHRLQQYLNKIKNLKFVIILGVKVVAQHFKCNYKYVKLGNE